jgi:diguanylate cyclase (GGDEF)-like protein
MYAFDVLLNPSIPSAEVLTVSTAIRLVTYSGIGVILGWFASHHRELVEQLRILAERDSLTGLPNTRAFEAAINRRLDAERPFALLIGDMDGLRSVNELKGHPEGDLLLHRLADALGRILGPEDEVARVGGDEFAVLARMRPGDDARERATRLEAALGGTAGITFGWASYPADGDNALSLYRAADERLYARKLIRDRDTAGLAVLPVRDAALRLR